MTSEPDSKPGRRPPTIELKATEVENPTPAPDTAASQATSESAAAKEAAPKEAVKSEKAAASAAGGTSANRLKSHAVSAVVGAATMATIVAGLWIVGVLPTHEAASPNTAVPSGAITPSPAPPAIAIGPDISKRLDDIEQAIKAQPRPEPDPALGNRLAALDAQTKSVGDSLAALGRRVDGVAATSQSAAKQADTALAATEAAKISGQSSAQRSDIDTLTNRIAALESALQTLSENAVRAAASADDRAARLTIAAEALRAAVERGVPYPSELAAVKSLGVDGAATAALEPFAASGLPSATALGRELAALTSQLDRASGAAPAETSFLGRLQANAQSLVRVTPVDAPAGHDASALVARIAGDAARDDIAAALADIGDLPDAAKPLAADWAKNAQARAAAIAASHQIAADALAALSKPAVQ